MWPLDRTPHAETLRIGRCAAERWAGVGAGLSLKAVRALPAGALSEPECLLPELGALYSTKPQGPVTVVLESAWLPLLLADTGGVLWSAAQAEGLLRHRLRSLYGSSDDDLLAWDVRVDFRAGERFALGYGLAPRVKQALLSAAEQNSFGLHALTPAFVWGWQRLRPERSWPRKTGWYLWAEQDRRLVARFEAGRLVAFNPAVPLSDGLAGGLAGGLTGGLAEAKRIVGVEGRRGGFQTQGEPISTAAWVELAKVAS